MLYERWHEIARAFRSETALIDVSSGRHWTFHELATTADRTSKAVEPVVYPCGTGPEFVLGVLRGWRLGTVVCPVEHGQIHPRVGPVPAGCVHMKTTSASTGAARLIAFTGAQLATDATNIVGTMGLRPEWPNLAVISLAHSYGFSNLVLPLLLHGIPLILAHSPLPETLRQAAAHASGITLPAVPALWRTWADAEVVPSHVRLAISAGAPLPLSVETEVFERVGIKIHNFYGASECGGIAYDRSLQPRKEASCVGTPLDNVMVDLNENGCLTVCGPAVGLTYWPEPSAQLAAGCYVSSDLATLSGDVISLRGRLTDQIIVAGRKVAPETIERVLANHPEVRECVVFGAPSLDHRTETIVACLATRSPVTGGELRQHLLAFLPAWQVPREWWFVSHLEANGRGKIPRHEWRRRYLARDGVGN